MPKLPAVSPIGDAHTAQPALPTQDHRPTHARVRGVAGRAQESRPPAMQQEVLTAAIMAETAAVNLVDEYLARWPSGRVSHHRNDLLGALLREQAMLDEDARKASDRAAEAASRLKARGYDAHTKAMAARLGISEDEFLARQAVNREEMGG